MLLIATATISCLMLGSITQLAAQPIAEYPSFDPPSGIEIYELGKRANWPYLRDMLALWDTFYVTNNETWQHLKAIQRRVDESGSSWFFWTALHQMVSMHGGDDGELMQRFLALGIDPDQTDGLGERPSHIASWFGRSGSARALALCRADLKATCTQHESTPAQEAARQDDVTTRAQQAGIPVDEFKGLREKVLEAWLEAEKLGTVSVAELGFKKEWWAVKNLFRRSVVTAEEAFATWEGKNVQEWAEIHGESGLAAELRYWMGPAADSPLERFPFTTISEASAGSPATAEGFSGTSTELQAAPKAEPQLPPFNPPANTQVFQLGQRANWPYLRDILTSFDTFYVTNNETQQHLKAIQQRIDASGSDWFFWTALHQMVSMNGGDDGDLVQRFLSLGVDPDQADAMGERPSHLASWFGRSESARALILCRADLKATCRQHSSTPAKEATREDDITTRAEQAGISVDELRRLREKTAEVWLGGEKNGVISVAELANRKEWWAVKNLFRRGVVTSEEAFADFEGKTAEEWASAHGEHGLAAELRYWESQLAKFGPETRQALFLLKESVEERLQSVERTGEELKAEVKDIKAAVVSLRTLLLERRQDQ